MKGSTSANRRSTLYKIRRRQMKSIRVSWLVRLDPVILEKCGMPAGDVRCLMCAVSVTEEATCFDRSAVNDERL